MGNHELAAPAMPRHGMPFETSNPQAGDHKQPFFRQLNKTGPTRCAAFLAPSIQAIVVVVAAEVATVAQSERPSVVHECHDATISPPSLSVMHVRVRLRQCVQGHRVIYVLLFCAN